MRCWNPSTGCGNWSTAGDYTARLALFEEIKTMPLGAVWDYCCLQAGVPVGLAWLDSVRKYEADVLSARR